jgi:superfamily II DNA or RNA helicase
LEFARRELQRRAVDGVVVACPTAPLTRQWAHAAHQLGLELLPDAESPRPPAGFHGVVVTYARIAQSVRQWAGAARERTLIIADEAHHLGEELAWGDSFTQAFRPAKRWLLLSGTPFRSDATAIPGVDYDSEGMAEPDISYTYADAVKDGVCRPVVFVTYDGTLSWRSGDDGSSRASTPCCRRERRAVATAPQSRPSCRTACRASSARPTAGSRCCVPAATRTPAVSPSRPTPSTPAGSPS